MRPSNSASSISFVNIPFASRSPPTFRERHMLHRIAERFNNLDRDLMPRPAQPIRNVIRLPQSQLRPP
jgi:hypothetical protein